MVKVTFGPHPRRGRVKVVRIERRTGKHECPDCGRRHGGGLFAEPEPIRLRDCSIGDAETYLEVRPVGLACCGGTRVERLPFAINSQIAALRFQARGYRDPEYFKPKILQRRGQHHNPWARIVL